MPGRHKDVYIYIYYICTYIYIISSDFQGFGGSFIHLSFPLGWSETDGFPLGEA